MHQTANTEHCLASSRHWQHPLQLCLQPCFLLTPDCLCLLPASHKLADSQQPLLRLLPADRINIRQKLHAKPHAHLLREFLQAVICLSASAKHHSYFCSGQLRQLLKRHIAGELTDNTHPKACQKARNLQRIMSPRTAVIANQQRCACLLRARLDKTLHELLCNLEIALVIFAVQKAAAINRQHRNAILSLRLTRCCVHIVTDNSGHAGISNNKALRLIAFHGKAHAFRQALHAAKNAVFLLHLAAQQRHRGMVLAAPLGQRPVLRIDIHRARHMSAGTRTMKNHHHAVHIGHRTPNARHTAAAAFAAAQKTFRLNCHIQPPASPAHQTSSASAQKDFRCS